MAEDKLNDGSEEERKSSSMSDDDFGLPDLEFDDLQELDLSNDFEEGEEAQEETPSGSDSLLAGAGDVDMSMLDDLSLGGDDVPSPSLDSSVLDEGIDEVEDVLDSAQLISDRLGDDDDDVDIAPSIGAEVNYDDLLGVEDTPSLPSEPEETDSVFASDSSDSLFGADDEDSAEDIMSSDDLFASIDSPDDLAALGMADEEESDTDSLFATDSVDMSSDDEDSLFDSESVSFGSMEDEPVTEPDDKKLPDNYKAYTYNESSGGFTKVIVIGVVVIAVIAAGMLWLSGDPDEEKGKVAKVETPVAKPKPKEEKPAEPVAEEVPAEEATPVVDKPADPEPEVSQPVAEASAAPAGEIVQVQERTGLSYIVIGSFIDEDLAMDYAKELSAEGRGVKIISPFGSSKRYRVSVADYSTYGDAASSLGSFKDEFGDQVWALKY